MAPRDTGKLDRAREFLSVHVDVWLIVAAHSWAPQSATGQQENRCASVPQHLRTSNIGRIPGDPDFRGFHEASRSRNAPISKS